ncbi:hypothetical protein E1J38_008065 [Seonamhaeicola sediminis]|uniref:DUF4249 family protein n=1 Tax=Seonamhaeicola sediminis TaxID=2528206 RepID=A0A562YDT2_9FLAO|nr:hypothetical protein [Seonamhaeicola sediminis]TWO32811.1 hypothetical protein E1J38_008065 [Seonamhaeicola sediminis]
MKRQYLYYLLSMFFIFFASCDDVLDCIINVRPELQNKSLEFARVDQFYLETISAEVKNEPNDNGYNYYFTVTGNIPKGIEVYYDYRKVIFEGTPIEKGRFTIRVSLYVESLDECYYDDFEGRTICHDPLCTNNTSRAYTLSIH